jgi:hypothetical protein
MGSIDQTRRPKPGGILVGRMIFHLSYHLDGHKEKGKLQEQLGADDRLKPRRRVWISYEDVSKHITVPIDQIAQDLRIILREWSLAIDANRDGNMRDEKTSKDLPSSTLKGLHIYSIVCVNVRMMYVACRLTINFSL